MTQPPAVPMTSSEGNNSPGAEATSPNHRSPVALILTLSLVALLYIFGRYGAAQDLANQRILWELDGGFQTLLGWATTLRQWTFVHKTDCAAAIAIWCAVLAVLAILFLKRKALPTTLGLLALATGGIGQALIFDDRATLGLSLLGAAFASAFAMGILQPFDKIDGFPSWRRGARGGGETRRIGKLGAVLMLALLVVVVIARTYAMTELRAAFDGESIHEMNMSRTVFGMRHYLSYSFIANASGLLQLPPQSLAYYLFGTSIFSQRFSAAIVGSFVILLSYFFVRRVAGAWPALLTAALLALAPEQLYWSRSEVTQFAAVLLVAIVLLQLAFAMSRDLSFFWTLATALWMPMCRLVYTPGWALVGLPWMLAAHSLVFGGTRRLKLLYVVPMLLLGTAMWAYSPSIVRWTFLDSSARFVSPTEVYGHSFVRRSGELRELETSELVTEQVRGVATRSWQVVEQLFDDSGLITHWYSRSNVSGKHRTIANAGLVIWAFCGFFYLLAGIRDPRAFGLMIAIGLAVTPTLMSPDPYPRRMLVIFLLLPIGAAIFAAALIRGSRDGRRNILSHLLTATTIAACFAIAAAEAQSYFELKIAPSQLLKAHRFTRPIFDQSDAVFHNLPYQARGNLAQMIALGSLDNLVEKGTAFEPVDNWITAALAPKVRYSNLVHDVIFSPEERAELRLTNPMKRLSYILEDSPKSARAQAMLKGLFPNAKSARGAGMTSYTVDRSSIDSLTQPEIILSPGRTSNRKPVQLNGVGTSTVQDPDATYSSITAGVVVAKDGWRAWTIEPACKEAALSLNGRPLAWGETTTALSGVHSMQIDVPDTCPLPTTISEVVASTQRRPAHLVSTKVATKTELRPTRAHPYEGFSAAAKIATIPMQAMDIAADSNGNVSVLAWDSRKTNVIQLDRNGRQVATWPAGADFPVAIAVADDGTHAVLYHRRIKLFSRDGKLKSDKPSPGVEQNSMVTFWGKGQILVSSRQDRSLNILGRDGALKRRIKNPVGIGRSFMEVRGIATDHKGTAVVTDESNRIFVLRAPPNAFNPSSAKAFPIEATARGIALDRRGRIVLPAENGFHIYQEDGSRLIASDPDRDMANKRFGHFPIAAVAGDGVLFALDRPRRAVWRINW